MFCELWLAKRYLRSGKKEKIISLTALISMAGIAIGVLVLIVVISVMSGFDQYLQEKMIGTNAHLLLDFYNKGKDPYRAVEELKKIPHVEAAAPYVVGQAVIKTGQQIFGVELRGIDPQLQPQVTKIKEYLRGHDLTLSGNEVLLGEELGYRLGIRKGDTVSLISPATLAKTDFKAKGFFNSGMYLYDSTLVITDLTAAQEFYKTAGQVSGIAVKIDDLKRTEEIKRDIYRKFDVGGQYEIRTWEDTNRNFLNAIKLEKIVMFIVVTMTTVVAAFGIISTLIMSVFSRIKDIGILRSVGAKTGGILQIFLFQGLGIGVTGIVLGLAGGLGLASSLNRIVDFISKIIGRPLIPQDIYYFDRIPTNISFSDTAAIVISAFIITLLASAYPAYFAARINPSEALRHE